MGSYSRTDLACEMSRPGKNSGIRTWERRINGFRMEETERPSERGNGQTERYATLHLGRIWEMDGPAMDRAADAAAQILVSFLPELRKKPSAADACILVAGLGNRFITADSIGPRTADLVTVTNHAADTLTVPALLGCRRVCALAPGVLGQTGMEAAALIADAASASGARAVIAVDALAARSTRRLGTTLQISDTGIQPGSGIGNHRTALTRETLGVPVIAMGVPTVVDCATLLEDALHRAGIDAPDEPLEKALREGKRYIVSPRESDLIASSVSQLLAGALNRALNPLLVSE